jgi:hypothetical protein
MEERSLAKCVHCGGETILLVSGTPICPKCDEEHEQKLKKEYERTDPPSRH